ncbi:hypothetical protein EDB92DRAFT_251924 [Lactarius akahatsu]|uniref:Uncharacterized protein n=1 Tax=Lactarius akahatsu TaxID=416441 RepID=A0AAD4LL93_9AGAM|nr:hypothetical protein EDB92DRAFT_251924 [Lactarius akahatsu]
MLKTHSTNRRRFSAPTHMNRSKKNSCLPGGPSPDYQSTETQHQTTSAPGGSNPQTPGRTPGSVDKPSQEGADVVPAHSVVSRRPDFASAQLTPPQPAQYSDIEGKRSPARGSQSEPPSAAMAADPEPILHVKSASEDSGYDLSRGPSDAARLHPENPSSVSPEAPSAGAGGDAQRSASLASRRTNGSAFANGAATTTNDPPDVDPSLQARAASAEGELKPRDKAAISKEEKGVGRKLSKIIRSEAKAEKAALDVALGELAEIQKLQKASVKEEAESHTRHSRALSDAHKAEMNVLIARTANEREQAGLRAAGEELEACRKHARETTDMLRDKMQEIERLRVYKGVDDRERAVKVKRLVGQKRFNRILRSA